MSEARILTRLEQVVRSSNFDVFSIGMQCSDFYIRKQMLYVVVLAPHSFVHHVAHIYLVMFVVT